MAPFSLKGKRKIILAIAAVAVLAVVLALVALFPKSFRNDWKRLASDSYDTVYLSMYPISNYEEEPFAYWRGMDIVVSEHEISNFLELKAYLKHIADSGNPVSTIYLGVLPERLDSARFDELMRTYPHIRFEVILPYPSLDYWTGMSETKSAKLLQTYRDFATPILGGGNYSLYFFGGSEWLVSNPANYEDTFLTTDVISETMMLHSDIDHSYVLKPETAEQSFQALADLMATARTSPTEYPDLSDWDIIFFGDSVIGNFTGSASIPGVVAGLTGAHSYNAGLGGGSVTESESDNFSLPNIATALTTGDLSLLPGDGQTYTGIENYLAQDHTGRQLCFVIHYGFNDYFMGAPVASDDPFDIYTFSGALRESIRILQEAYPDAYILLDTPNYTSYYNSGKDPCNGSPHPLEDYVNAITSIAAEYETGLMDHYRTLPIDGTNYWLYLNDGCHPSEAGRFLMGRRIAETLGTLQ